MAKRIIIVCEGETEQAFCKTNIQPYFETLSIYIDTPLIKRTKGGIVKWEVLKKQIEQHLLSDTRAIITTFIDYYGIYQKHDFPDWAQCEKIVDKNQRMEALENAMSKNISDNLSYRFMPYLQLHEFEGLLFNDINIFYQQIPQEDIVDKDELEAIFAQYDNPEMINNNRETAPSYRLQRIIKGYRKVVYGDILAEAIGLANIRQKCPRFHQWLTKLEQI
jgi:hypothetical protein